MSPSAAVAARASRSFTHHTGFVMVSSGPHVSCGSFVPERKKKKTKAGDAWRRRALDITNRRSGFERLLIALPDDGTQDTSDDTPSFVDLLID